MRVIIDFKARLPDWKIHDTNGREVDVRTLPDKSIKTDEMADELLLRPHYVGSYVKTLDDAVLLKQFMKYMKNLAVSCCTRAEYDKNWDATYNTSIIYLLDNFIVRYSDVFEKHGVATDYVEQPMIRRMYESNKEDISVTVKGKVLVDLSDIRECSYDSDIRANSAGFKALICHYSDEQFLTALDHYLDNCSYSSEQTNHWVLVAEVARRIRNRCI